MVTQSNPDFFKKLERALETDLPDVMLSALMNVESEAKKQVYGDVSGISQTNFRKNLKKGVKYQSHTDIDEYHPYGHLNRKTGTLGRSITSEVEVNGDEIKGIVGTNVVYAPIHEFGGTITQTTKKGNTRLIHIPARPFLTPALEIRKKDVISDLSDGIRKIIRECEK